SLSIVASSSVPSICACKRKALSAVTSQPQLAWLVASRGADQNLSAFSISRRVSLASPRLLTRNRRVRPASQPHLAWLFASQGADQNLSAFSIARQGAASIVRNC